MQTETMPHFEPANWFWSFILRSCGCAGLTTPWRTIYLLPECFADPTLRAHELCHIAQLDRDGPWLFWPRCCWYVLRYGYWNSPYEIECRAAADLVRDEITISPIDAMFLDQYKKNVEQMMSKGSKLRRSVR